MSKDVVLVGFKRSPFQPSHKGAFAKKRPDDLLAEVIRALIAQTGVEPALLEDVIVGNAFPEGEQGFNIGRIVGQLVGLPESVAGVTVNRFCGSSMQAIHNAAALIMAGSGDAYIAAGVESMTRVPMGGYNPMPNPSLVEKYPAAYISMGETAENVGKKYGISRAEQEEFAVNSHRKAAEAQAAGRFDEEIVPIGDVKTDGTIRPETTVEILAGLKPAFDVNGTVTAGTSSPLTDGAAATLICSLEFAQKYGLKPMAKIRSMAVSGCDAALMGLGPVASSHKALQRAGLSLDDIDIVELNEAFAAQSLGVLRELNIDPAKLNADGGAIALGHPLGASGVRVTAKAAQRLQREGKKYALATMCIGGGQGIATVLERI
ncbi:MAG: fadA3 [Alphaproteobacteria bacterium]|nr:fadA3 [Alphaproteobacteria bacterium]